MNARVTEVVQLRPLLVDRVTAARMLSICPRTLDRLVEDGRLRCVRIERRKLFSVSMLEEAVRRMQETSVG